MALIVLVIQLGLTIGLFQWSRQLNNEYIHPLEVTSKVTI